MSTATAALDSGERAYVLGWLTSAIESTGSATQADVDAALVGVAAERQREMNATR